MSLADEFKAAAGDAITEEGVQVGKPSFTVRADAVKTLLAKAHRMGYDHLCCLTAVDWPEEKLMDVWYNLYSYRAKEHLALRCRLPRDKPDVDSVVAVWKGADWFEREAYDMFGIRFKGHPDLKRLLLPDGWVGFPLRKDYDRAKQQYVNLNERGEDTVSYKEAEGW